MTNQDKEEKMILKHDAIPPYKTVFYIVFTLGLLYLIVIIILGLK